MNVFLIKKENHPVSGIKQGLETIPLGIVFYSVKQFNIYTRNGHPQLEGIVRNTNLLDINVLKKLENNKVVRVGRYHKGDLQMYSEEHIEEFDVKYLLNNFVSINKEEILREWVTSYNLTIKSLRDFSNTGFIEYDNDIKSSPLLEGIKPNKIAMTDKIDILNAFAGVVSKAHSEFPIKERAKFRGHDKETPYYVHPVGCAYFIMEDNNSEVLSYNERLKLALSMMGHDVIEDTTVTVEQLRSVLFTILNDKELTDEIIEYILSCTIEPNMGSMDEYKKLKDNPELIKEEIWYLKLVDKYYNVFGSKEYFLKKGTLGKYLEFLEFLTAQVEKTKYKESMFIPQSKSIIATLKEMI